MSHFFNNLGLPRITDYEIQGGYIAPLDTRVAGRSRRRFRLPRDFGVVDNTRFTEEDLPGAIYYYYDDPIGPTTANTTTLPFHPLPPPTLPPLSLPRELLPAPPSSTLVESLLFLVSHERTQLASPASPLQELDHVTALPDRPATPKLQYPDPVATPSFEAIPSEHTFGSILCPTSLSYHVCTPLPQPLLSRTPSPVARSPALSPPSSHVHPVPELTPASDQENVCPPPYRSCSATSRSISSSGVYSGVSNGPPPLVFYRRLLGPAKLAPYY